MAQEPTQKKPGLLELLDEWEKQGASDAEIMERTRNYLSYSAREKGVPIRGAFELTPLCNLHCKMCYVHLTQSQLEARNESILSTERWKEIMSQAIDAGMFAATLTGGEAMLHPGFDELYLFLAKQGIELYIKTNGLLLTREKVSLFEKNNPVEIQVSLYGSDDESYRQVTGHSCFAEIIEGIKRALEADLSLHIAITPSKYMLENADQLLKLAESLGCSYSINSQLLNPRVGTGRENQQHDLTIDEYVEVYKIMAQLKGHELVPICAERIPIVGSGKEPEKGLLCGAGRDGFMINWRGEMQPCVSMTKFTCDLSSFSFMECWKQIHQYVLDYPRPQECEGCVFQGSCISCVVQHEYGAPPGHANPEICKRAKKFLSEGLLFLRD